MENIVISLLLTQLILLPLSFKWKLNPKTVLIGGSIIGVFVGFAVNILAVYVAISLSSKIAISVILILVTSASVVLLRFYRDPERVPPGGGNIILSPADGTVIYVKEVEKGSSLVSTKGEKRFEVNEIMAAGSLVDVAYLIGIDMNLLNVHINRSPIGGKIVFQKHIKGQFLSLRRQESEMLNERVATIIDNEVFRIGVIQIASRLVRRIVSYLTEGDDVSIGQRIGAIVFGSQVDVAIPEIKNLKINVRPGDKVKAGVSIIGKYE